MKSTEITKESTTGRLKGGFADVTGSTVARALVMPISAVAVLLSSSLITQQRGVEGFALFSIFISLPYMVPISDFGISVSVTDTLANNGPNSSEFRYVWRRTLVLLSCISAVTVVAAGVLALTGSWSVILGLPASSDTELAGLSMMVIMALGIPLGAGQRALLGLGKQTKATILSSSSGCISLVLVWISLAFHDAGYSLLAVAYGLGPLLMQLTIFVMALRSFGWRQHESTRYPAAMPVRILRLALPMAVLTLALPLTYQTDRVLLSHSSDLLQVADYSYVSMYYGPLLSVITIGSQALWPLFIKILANPRRLRRQFRRADGLFSALGLVMMLGLVVAGPFVTQIVSSGQGAPPIELYITFGAMLLFFGINASSGMLLMDHTGRKIQALGAVTMLGLKIPLSLTFIPFMGATGAVVATLIPMIICMVIPTRIVALSRIRKGSVSI